MYCFPISIYRFPVAVFSSVKHCFPPRSSGCERPSEVDSSPPLSPFPPSSWNGSSKKLGSGGTNGQSGHRRLTTNIIHTTHSFLAPLNYSKFWCSNLKVQALEVAQTINNVPQVPSSVLRYPELHFLRPFSEQEFRKKKNSLFKRRSLLFFVNSWMSMVVGKNPRELRRDKFELKIECSFQPQKSKKKVRLSCFRGMKKG